MDRKWCILAIWMITFLTLDINYNQKTYPTIITIAVPASTNEITSHKSQPNRKPSSQTKYPLAQNSKYYKKTLSDIFCRLKQTKPPRPSSGLLQWSELPRLASMISLVRRQIVSICVVSPTSDVFRPVTSLVLLRNLTQSVARKRSCSYVPGLTSGLGPLAVESLLKIFPINRPAPHFRWSAPILPSI